MQSQLKSFEAKDQKEIFYHQWTPNDFHSVKAVLQIAHGLAEHSARYERLAKALIEKGYIVYADDHRGHGKTAGGVEELGYFEDGNFWEKTVSDIIQLHKVISKKHPDVPIFLLGHSAGSFLLRKVVTLHNDRIAGLILSATGGDPGMLGKVGLAVAKGMATFGGRKKRNKILDKMSFGEFNNAFKPNRTAFDWLSRDEAEVNKYIDDPYCGEVSTTGLWIDLVSGILEINNTITFKKTRKDLPILMLAGDLDPVGDQGKGVKEVYEKYKKAGIKNLQLKLYPGARHEILNETNRDEVTQDIIDWMEKLINN